MFYKKFGKPVFDFILSLFVLIILSPFLIISIIILFIVNKGEVFFIQERPGKRGKIFKVIKLKTMNDKCDAGGNLLPDSDRITPIGKIIRQLSIDEIPQLFNVFCGQMSFVGPRPLLKEYLPLYSGFELNRHQVKPGITGWAQVNGRNAISWKKKFEYDIWYVEHYTFLLDIKILFLTLFRVIRREGINADIQETMEKFTGSN